MTDGNTLPFWAVWANFLVFSFIVFLLGLGWVGDETQGGQMNIHLKRYLYGSAVLLSGACIAAVIAGLAWLIGKLPGLLQSYILLGSALFVVFSAAAYACGTDCLSERREAKDKR